MSVNISLSLQFAAQFDCWFYLRFNIDKLFFAKEICPPINQSPLSLKAKISFSKFRKSSFNRYSCHKCQSERDDEDTETNAGKLFKHCVIELLPHGGVEHVQIIVYNG